MPTRTLSSDAPARRNATFRPRTGGALRRLASPAGATLVVIAALASTLPDASLAAEPRVRIVAPAPGAKLDAMQQNQLVYEVDPGPRGDHVHVYVDDKEVGILRQLKGTYTLETLAPGSRRICVKVVNKAHTPTGIEDCVTATVD